MKKRLPTFLLWISISLIILSIVLLIAFKLLAFTSMYAAYIVAGSAMLGGIGLVISSLTLFFRNDKADVWSEKLLFHLPEIIVVGLAALAFGFILLWGGMIK